MVARRDSEAVPLIPQFYAGRSIFITGATGFMGKVLIERILATCPDVDRLYLLVRHKKDVSPEKRLQQLIDSPVFDPVRATDPAQLDKLSMLAGDITKPDLGMSQESLLRLHDVSVVFHSAATLKFDEAMKMAVEQNVLSVIRLLEICDRLPNMQAFVHVSTAYSNAELREVEEHVYPPKISLQQLLAVSESLPEDLMMEITPKFISPKPNTYTFTKAMAEHAVQQHGNKGYACAIFRPTIVISSVKHPYPGWIENLNGPSGVIAAAGKGLLHVFCCNPDAAADMLPVDIAIDTLLAVAWETAIDKSKEVRVYNCSTRENPTDWRGFEQALRRYIVEHPLDRAYWYPSGASVGNTYAQKAIELLTQTVPLHLVAYTIRLLGIKTQLNLITVSHRLQAMNKVLKFFAQREWVFHNENVRRLRARISPQDAKIYNLDPNSFDWDEHYCNFIKGTRKYLLKEKEQDIEEARKHIKKMFYVHYSLLLFVVVLLLRFALNNSFVRQFVYGVVRTLTAVAGAVFSRISA
ncbi:putative fatty acyl-CoA reductase CG5065 [Plodia interpunctella]|uniref:putative fatty acyl-CoA reductase CG5065 n=1 Tax=Plodia interpunctella TaxID=58824 RepID=UPI0023678595|nr:putative fatty acyl-CoA reductase CG5065 [Plodia interpunctella]